MTSIPRNLTIVSAATEEFVESENARRWPKGDMLERIDQPALLSKMLHHVYPDFGPPIVERSPKKSRRELIQSFKHDQAGG
jgi:hypothetical protein